MTCIKGTNEVRIYRINFSNIPEVVDNGESIASIVTNPSVNNGETGLTISAISLSSNKVLFTASGGTLGVTYEIYCLVRTTASNDIEAYFDIRIEKTKS